MRRVVDFFLVLLTIFILVVVGNALGEGLVKQLDIKPKVPSPYISYCWAKDHGLYLPCMYSKKVYSA